MPWLSRTYWSARGPALGLEMQNNYPFLLGAPGCALLLLLFETVCLASVLNVTARCRALRGVVHQLRARSVVTHAACAVCLRGHLGPRCALLSAQHQPARHPAARCALHRGLVPGSAVCTVVRRGKAIYKLVVLATALLFFCLPMPHQRALLALVAKPRLRRERGS